MTTYRRPTYPFLILCLVSTLLMACSRPPSERVAYFLSHHPDDHKSRPLRHYPVARQGNLTAWVTSNHVSPPANWLFAPGDSNPKYPIVGRIRARDMPGKTKHDGSFLVVSGYQGPIYDLWLGTTGKGQMYTGGSRWVPVKLNQPLGVNTWVLSRQPIGGWSGFPVVIGDPAKPDAIAGALWYRDNTRKHLGGTTSSRFLKDWLSRLNLQDFVKKTVE